MLAMLLKFDNKIFSHTLSAPTVSLQDPQLLYYHRVGGNTPMINNHILLDVILCPPPVHGESL